MADDYPIESTKSKFNQAGDILQTISYLKYNSIEAHSKGELEKWFNNWKEVKFLLIGRMSDETKKMYLKLERNIAFVLGKDYHNNIKYRNILIRLIEIYIEKLQTQMEDWGMGIVDAPDERKFA